jgi:hypothetical protein
MTMRRPGSHQFPAKQFGACNIVGVADRARCFTKQKNK